MKQDELKRLIEEYLGPTQHLPVQWQTFLSALDRSVTSGAMSEAGDLTGIDILTELASEISVSAPLTPLLTKAARYLSTYLDATSVYICNWDAATGESQVLAEYISSEAGSIEGERSTGRSYNLREDFAEIDNWLDGAKQPLALNPEISDLSESLRRFYHEHQVRSALYLPISVDGRTTGYVETYNSREAVRYSEPQLSFGMAVANLAATAMQNRSMYHGLQASEQRFRGLVENTTELITVLDEHGTVEYISPAVTLVLGYPADQLLGKNLFALIHEEDREDVIQQVNNTQRNPGTTFVSSFRLRHRNQSWMHMEASGNAAADDSGEARSYVSMRDTTSREQRSEREREQFERRGLQAEFINTIANQIGVIERSGDLYQLVVDAVHRDLDIHYHLVQFFKYAPATNELVLTAAAGGPARRLMESGLDYRIGEGTVGKAASRLRSVLVANTAQSVDWAPTPGVDDTQSEIATPVIMGSALIGVLNVQSTQSEDIDADVQLLLEVLAGLVAVSSESIRLRQEMSTQMAALNALQRNTAQGSIRESGAPLPPVIGYDPHKGQEELPGPVARPAGTGSLVRPMQVAGQRIGAIAIEADPNEPLSAEEQALLDEITSEVSEALERARLFEASQRSAAELAVLNEMGNAFTEDLNEQAIVENIYRYTAQLMTIDDFYVALYDEPTQMVSFPYVHLNNERVAPGHELWPNFTPRPVGTGLTGHVIQHRQPVLIENNAEEVLERLQLPYVQVGQMTESWLGVPMSIGERTLGMINVQSDSQPGLYTQRHLGLLTAIASQAAIAIDNARLLQDEQRRAEQERLVRTITDRVRRGADIQSILRIALEEVGLALDAEVSVAQLGTREDLLSARQRSGSAADEPPSNGAHEEPAANGATEPEPSEDADA